MQTISYVNKRRLLSVTCSFWRKLTFTCINPVVLFPSYASCPNPMRRCDYYYSLWLHCYLLILAGNCLECKDCCILYYFYQIPRVFFQLGDWKFTIYQLPGTHHESLAQSGAIKLHLQPKSQFPALCFCLVKSPTLRLEIQGKKQNISEVKEDEITFHHVFNLKKGKNCLLNSLK